MNARKISVAAMLAVALFSGWTWWNSDSRRIGGQLNAMMDSVSKSAGENQLAGALKAQEFAGLYADPFRFRARQFDFETRDRQDLVRAVALYRMRSDRIATRILDRRLDIDSAARRATMVVTARFVGGWMSAADDAYRFQLDWVEQNGEWRVDYADLVEIVRASGL